MPPKYKLGILDNFILERKQETQQNLQTIVKNYLGTNYVSTVYPKLSSHCNHYNDGGCLKKLSSKH